MIKTKKGYHSITNGFVTWCFYEQAATSVLTAFIDGDIDKVYEFSILVVNNETGNPEKSNWPNSVTNEHDLGEHLKRERLQGIDND